MRRLVTAEQHKTNTTVGQSLHALRGGTDDAAHVGTHIALQQGLDATGVAIDQPAWGWQTRNRAALWLLSRQLRRGWQSLLIAPCRKISLEDGKLRQAGAELNASEAAAQEGMEQLAGG
jgi:hypothetical protein